MVVLALLAALDFTNPTRFVTADTTCIGDNAPTTAQLARVNVYGVRRWQYAVQLLATKPETVLGLADSISFPDSGAVWTIWARWANSYGKESCPSNMVTISPTSAVERPAPDARDYTIYDVAGKFIERCHATTIYDVRKRIKRTYRPGIYVVKSAAEKTGRKTIVIR